MRDCITTALERAQHALDALQRNVAERTLPALEERKDDLIAVLNQLVGMIGDLVEAPLDSATPSCSACAKRETCKEPCNRIADILPGEFEGRGHREHLCGIQPNRDTDDHRDTTGDRFFIFQNNAHLFTPKQWRVVYLYYSEGKTETEIAKSLGICPAAVSERLKTAKRRLEEGQARRFPKNPE